MQIQAEAILFDSDGVLVDSHEYVITAWQQLMSEFGIQSDNLLAEMIGVRAVDSLSRVLPPDVVPEAVARLEDIEVSFAHHCVPMPGAIDFLAQLPSDRWTIVTSGTTRLASARWQGAGIPVPSQPITADDVTAGKPNPEPYLAGAAALGVDPQLVVVFEDSPSGGKAGRAAGAAVVAVGDQPWPEIPTARVNDLSRVAVTSGPSGLTLTIS